MSLFPPSTDAGRIALDTLLSAPSRALVAVDFDGTLAPIVDDPRTSSPYPGVVPALAELAGLVAKVAVITGRPAETAVSLGGLEQIPDVTVLGHYGGEHWVGGRVIAADPPPGVALVRSELPALVDRVAAPEGTWIEDKGRSLAVHTRRTADPDAALSHLLPHLVALAERAGLQVEPGRMVIELRPRGVDKGAALASLVKGVGAGSVFYAGDDLGDLPAFATVAELRGRGVPGLRVSASSDEVPEIAEAADLVVSGPAGLAEFLDALLVKLRLS